MMRRRGWAGLVLVLFLAAVSAAWLFRDDIVAAMSGTREPVEVSPEAADLAEAKLRALLEDGREARLSEIEISSLLRYRSGGFGEGTIDEPSVSLAGDTLILIGNVATDSLPSHPELNAVRPFLPERAPIEVRGHMRPLAEGRAAFEISAVEFAGLPIPQRYYPDVLQRVGRRDEPGLATNAVAIRMPPGVGGIRIEGGYLILTP